MMFKGPNVLRRNAKKSAPQPITWCHNPYAEMLLKVRTQGKGQVNVAEMPTLLHPSQPITGGHRKHAEMPQLARPHQFLWCQADGAEMPWTNRAKGKGHLGNAKMPRIVHPSQPITGGQIYHAEMPRWPRPQPITGGHACSAEMPLILPPPPNLGHTSSAAMSG